jgi:hypothetical protein
MSRSTGRFKAHPSERAGGHTPRGTNKQAPPSTSRRAQASMEFMILFILFLVAITTALMVSINRSYSIL